MTTEAAPHLTSLAAVCVLWRFESSALRLERGKVSSYLIPILKTGNLFHIIKLHYACPNASDFITKINNLFYSICCHLKVKSSLLRWPIAAIFQKQNVMYIPSATIAEPKCNICQIQTDLLGNSTFIVSNKTKSPRATLEGYSLLEGLHTHLLSSRSVCIWFIILEFYDWNPFQIWAFNSMISFNNVCPLVYMTFLNNCRKTSSNSVSDVALNLHNTKLAFI